MIAKLNIEYKIFLKRKNNNIYTDQYSTSLGPTMLFSLLPNVEPAAIQFHSFEVLAVNCSTLEVQQLKIDDHQTHFCNEEQSAGLEWMNGA